MGGFKEEAWVRWRASISGEEVVGRDETILYDVEVGSGYVYVE